MRALTHLRGLLEAILARKGAQWPDKATIEPPKDKQFGDMACNVAMLTAGKLGKKPRDLALELREELLAMDPGLAKVDVAGPGFLNVTFAPSFWQKTVEDVLELRHCYGKFNLGRGRKVQVEFVSANPTGPLHIGHGRGAAVGDALARILRAMDFEVSTEYYINDAGRQMRLLGRSIWVRLLELLGRPVDYPEDWYKGEYIIELARELHTLHGKALADGDPEAGQDVCYDYGMKSILEGIQKDLSDFRVEHQVWFSEKSLVAAGKVEKTLDALKTSGLAYEKDGALWMGTSQFGDDKDRVLRKSTGELTYFASDIAYHADKFARGFHTVVDIWGADHHGYVPRMKAAVQALGRDPEDLKVILVQLVNLLRGGEQIAMSTRAGQFETLSDVCKEVGVDAARFMFLSRKSDSHLDFDLELVKQQTMDNPVYYVQYAHARVCSLFAKAAERGVSLPDAPGTVLSRLDTPEDLDLMRLLEQYPDTLASAASSMSPHVLSFYLRELAGLLHRYYSAHPVLTAPDQDTVLARMFLLEAVREVVHNGLDLLGVSAPDKM
ncbi:Arginine--tRNA ligase [Fundidesulfovibrio magnetotacticus]|uniref:Arginine--tRNA ligase n=1 Tax=Fundidesulfovibrio magnetotacticus TaxID=2730080 RepID=A0A6V8LWM9_9BACT|nr:arginine--tRNA ligase [Fundidesulfovibrio magnetotacticus]GFK95001.1 Arginine--tRNA ligase [Fundidesulfovibrio magnetotacticus]